MSWTFLKGCRFQFAVGDDIICIAGLPISINKKGQVISIDIFLGRLQSTDIFDKQSLSSASKT